jgi:hypothetical protein
MKVCENCGETQGRIINSPKFNKKLCMSCYTSFSQRGKDVHELPKYGETKFDEQGRPICHICGRAFRKLLSHVWQKHDMTKREYKEQFGLYTSKGLCAESTAEKLREAVKENYDLVVTENLIKEGVSTRYKEGHEGRTNEKVSPQLKKDLIERLPNKNKNGIEEYVEDIRNEYKEKKTKYRVLAERYSVSETTIGNIINEISYKRSK